MADMENIAAENARLKDRLKQYRISAALMLVDWHIVPSDGFKDQLRDRHMKILRSLIRGDLDMIRQIIDPPRQRIRKRKNVN